MCDRRQAALIGGALAAALIVLWLARYQTAGGAPGHFFLTDRWSGTVLHCAAPGWPSADPDDKINSAGGCVRAYPPQPPER